MILNAAMAIILRYFTECGIAEVTTNECITEGHLRDIDSLGHLLREYIPEYGLSFRRYSTDGAAVLLKICRDYASII